MANLNGHALAADRAARGGPDRKADDDDLADLLLLADLSAELEHLAGVMDKAEGSRFVGPAAQAVVALGRVVESIYEWLPDGVGESSPEAVPHGGYGCLGECAWTGSPCASGIA